KNLGLSSEPKLLKSHTLLAICAHSLLYHSRAQAGVCCRSGARPIYKFQNGTNFHLKILICFVYLGPLNSAPPAQLGNHQTLKLNRSLPHESVASFLHP